MDKLEIGEVFTISDDDNEDHEVEVLATISLENKEYVAVGFVEDIQEESDEDIDVFFMKVEDDGTFSPIEDDDEFNTVTSAFDTMMDEESE
ncbi:DUF1292 domain-containing protein [Evansella sp. AB-rgal1]|uniref:DUF1292 domain-containing protein n=1 Tax=Evansella sp. AB-rgal1 TaxID=3242696 RepID=UPI00359DB140